MCLEGRLFASAMCLSPLDVLAVVSCLDKAAVVLRRPWDLSTPVAVARVAPHFSSVRHRELAVSLCLCCP